MEYHCLVCGEPLKDVMRRISHLQSHKLSLADLKTYHVFGWYPHQLKINISLDGLCPNCDSQPSSIIYDTKFISEASYTYRYLVRCATCLKLFFLYKKNKKVVTMGKDQEKRSCKFCKNFKEKYKNLNNVCLQYEPPAMIDVGALDKMAKGCEWYERSSNM